MRIWISFLLLILSSHIAAQNSFSQLKKSIETQILYSDFCSALDTINQIISQYPQPHKLELGVLKMKILTEFGLYDESFKLSQILLSEPYLTTEQLLVTRVERALIYEINDDLKSCEAELEKAEKLFAAHKELMPKNYTNFLVRKSSFYRISKNFQMSLETALKAKKYAESVQDRQNLPVAELVVALGYRKFNEKKELEHYLRALYLYKQLHHRVAVNSMYANLAKFHRLNNELETANLYIDSAMKNLSGSYSKGYIADIFLEKSEIMELKKNPDSALYFYKIASNLYKEETDKQRNLKVKELSMLYNFEQEKQEKERLNENFINSRKQNNRLIVFTSILALLACCLALLLVINSKNKRKIERQKQSILLTNANLEESLEEKQFLVKELNHRVKNNLAVILSLIDFQKDQVKNVKNKSRFEDLHKRIKTIMIAHELYTYNVNKNTNSTIEIKQYVERIFEAHKISSRRNFLYSIFTDSFSIHVDKALPLGLMLNEWIVNSIKHAQPKEDELILNMQLKITGKDLKVEYWDSGDFQNNPKKEGESLGLFIINGMAKQLGGELIHEHFHYKIIFPNE